MWIAHARPGSSAWRPAAAVGSAATSGRAPAFGGFLVLDGFALFFKALFLLSAVLVILSADHVRRPQQLAEAEFYVHDAVQHRRADARWPRRNELIIDLPGARSHQPVAGVPGGLEQARDAGQGSEHRGGHQVLPAERHVHRPCCCTAWRCCTASPARPRWSDISRVLTGRPRRPRCWRCRCWWPASASRSRPRRSSSGRPTCTRARRRRSRRSSRWLEGGRLRGLILRIFNGALPGISAELGDRCSACWRSSR